MVGGTMILIKRPIKAPTDPITNEQLELLTYPLVGSPKLDGFRCVVGNTPLTSSLKPFGNLFVRQELSHPIFAGLDGELIVGEPNDPDAFHNTSGPLRRFDGCPNFKFYVFDSFLHKATPYIDRWLNLPKPSDPRLVILEQKVLSSPAEVISYEKEMLEAGFEGAMIRSLSGKYKEGRCTFNEQNIFKRKPFVEAEAVIVGLEEEMQNLNEQVTDKLGLAKRSHHRENMIPKGTLGNFVLRSSLWRDFFRASPGKGFTAEIRQSIWNSRTAYIGQVVTIKYQKHGSRDAPRLPSVIKLRPMWDISGEI
jgi:DNA ligase-1